jgi:hypothetical protein
MIIIFVSSPVFALDPLGPPCSDLRKGEYKGGIDVSFSSQDLETDIGSLTEYVNGVVAYAAPVKLDTLNDLEMYRGYATVAFSPVYNWEAFVRLVGAGLRATFYEELALKIGGLIQANYSEYDGKVEASQWSGPHFLEIKMLEVQAAVGATYMFSDRFAIYGGPFAHVIYGDLDYVLSLDQFGDFVTLQLNWDIQDDITYGAYFGAQYKLKRDCAVTLEYQQTSNAYGIGAGVMFRL